MCFRDRKVPAILVTMLSVILVLIGVLILIQALVYEFRSSVLNTDLGSWQDITSKVDTFRHSTFGVLIAGSAVTMLIGCFGAMCLCKPCSRVYCSVIFGSILLVCWVLFGVIGAVITFFSAAGPKQMDAFCRGETYANNLEFLTDAVSTIDGKLINQANHFMCSVMCPCPEDLSKPWLSLTE